MAKGTGGGLAGFADDWLQVEVGRCVIPGNSMRASLVGCVVHTGPAVEDIAVGDRVVAIADPKATVTVRAQDCLRLSPSPAGREPEPYWALALTLIPVLRACGIQVGERVLVLSVELIGQMLAELAWLAGACSCIALDSSLAGSSDGPPRGPRFVAQLETLGDCTSANQVDLLLDASGNLELLTSNLKRVREAGRVLTVRRYSSREIDLNVYPDLHRQSMRFMTHQLATSLADLRSQSPVPTPSRLDEDLRFVQYLFELGRLHPSKWSCTPVIKPAPAELAEALEAPNRNALLVEW